MIKEYLKMYNDELKKSIEDLKHKDTFYKQVPNLLTFIRLVGGIPAGAIYSLNPYVSIVAIVLLWFTDAIDGRIATKFNVKSKLGADMDAFADKIMFLGSSLPLLMNTSGLILNFVLEGVISLINVIGRVKGLDTKTVLSGKVKTVSLAMTLVFGYLVQFFGVPSIIFNSLIGLTTGLQFIAIKDYIEEFIKMNKELKDGNFNRDIKDSNISDVLEADEDKDKNLIPEVDKTLSDVLRHEKELMLDSFEPNEPIEHKCRKRKFGKK